MEASQIRYMTISAPTLGLRVMLFQHVIDVSISVFLGRKSKSFLSYAGEEISSEGILLPSAQS